MPLMDRWDVPRELAAFLQQAVQPKKLVDKGP